jgi:hypothetical protein
LVIVCRFSHGRRITFPRTGGFVWSPILPCAKYRARWWSSLAAPDSTPLRVTCRALVERAAAELWSNADAALRHVIVSPGRSGGLVQAQPLVCGNTLIIWERSGRRDPSCGAVREGTERRGSGPVRGAYVHGDAPELGFCESCCWPTSGYSRIRTCDIRLVRAALCR